MLLWNNIYLTCSGNTIIFYIFPFYRLTSSIKTVAIAYSLVTPWLPLNHDHIYIYIYPISPMAGWVFGGDSWNRGVLLFHIDPATSCRHLLNFHNFDFHIFMAPLYSPGTSSVYVGAYIETPDTIPLRRPPLRSAVYSITA